MLIVFQTPFADVREFLPIETYQLEKPDWLIVNTGLNRDFLHRAGVIEKLKPKSKDWTSASIYCRAKKVFKFNIEEIEKLSKNRHGMVIHSRRLFSTETRELEKDSNGEGIPFQNKVINSLEIGFIHADRKKIINNPMSAKDLNCIIKNCVNLKVSINLPNKKNHEYKLYETNAYLSNIFLNATTKKDKIEHCNNWWVTSGAPLLIVEYSSSEVKNTPLDAKLIVDIKEHNIRIFFGELRINKTCYLRTWYVETNKLTKNNDVKMLLEGLLHINASQQCLNRVLYNLDKIEITKETSEYIKFQKYLEFTFASLFRRKKFGFPSTEFADILLECENCVSKSMRDGIKIKLGNLGIKQNCYNNLQRYIASLGGKNDMCLPDKNGVYNMINDKDELKRYLEQFNNSKTTILADLYNDYLKWTDEIQYDSVNPDLLNNFKSEARILITTVTDIETYMLHKSLIPISGYNKIIKIFKGNSTYYLGQLSNYKIVHVISSMGSYTRQGSADTIKDAISNWEPKLIISVGIGFGIKFDKQQLGDVLISSTIIPYDKNTKIKNNELFYRDIWFPKTSDLLKNRINNMPEIRSNADFKTHFGSILTGENLIDDPQYKQMIILATKQFDIVGGEMEAYGIFKTANDNCIENCITIKGVCDWAEGKNELAGDAEENEIIKNKHQIYAACNAVCICKKLLSQEYVFKSLEIDGVNE